MLENRDTRDSQEDVQALGQIILECLEPSTFLKEGKSLLKDWHSHVSNFVESTKLEANEGMVSKFHEIPGSHFHLARLSSIVSWAILP